MGGKIHFATFATMANGSVNERETKMAEGGNDAELLKEKANKYFKGKLTHLSGRWLLPAAYSTHRCDH